MILLQKSHLCKIISKHNSTKILERKLPQVFSLLCNTSPCLLYISMHTHCKGFLLHKFKNNKAKHLVTSLGLSPFFFSVTKVEEGMYSSVEVPEIWVSLPAPGRGCLEIALRMHRLTL